MSASVRPAIPRPTIAKASTPPPPVRERAATLDLEDDDIVGVAVAPLVPSKRSSAPPPPSVARSVPPPPPSHVAMKPASIAPPRPAPVSVVPPPVSVVPPAPMSVAPPAPVSVVPAPVSFAPPAPVSVVPAPVSVASAPIAPASVVPPASFSVPPPASIPAPIGAAPIAMPSVPPPAPVPAWGHDNVVRLSITDPTDVVFDGMYGLTFARSASEAAEMCAETLAKALGARAVVIHRHDLMSRELRAIGAHGDGDFDIIGSAETSEDDLVASAVICNQKSVTMTFDGELPSVAPKRLHHVGSPRTVVAAPAMSWGRCLAIVEVIDADERYAARVADSATYVAEQLAQFLLSRAA